MKNFRNRTIPLFVFLAFALCLSDKSLQARSIGLTYHNGSNILSVNVKDEVTGAVIDDAVIEIHGTEKLAEFGSTNRGLVRVSRDGYTSVSVIGLPATGDLTVFLTPYLSSAETIIYSGQFLNWNVEPRSKNVHSGAVFKTLSTFDLFHVNPDSFMSPIMDKIDVRGEREIPSNIVFPKHIVKLPFPLGSLNFDKPGYRIPIRSHYQDSLTGVQLKMTATSLIKKVIGGGDMGMDMLNIANFTNVGWADPSSYSDPNSIDFEANIALAPKYRVRIESPDFTNEVLLASFVDLTGSGERLIPTDLKSIQFQTGNRIRTAEADLAGPVQPIGQKNQILALAIKGEGERVSAVLVDPVTRFSNSNTFLPGMALPQTMPAVPTSLEVSTIESGLTVLTIERKIQALALEVAPSDQLEKIIILPTAGKELVDLSQIDTDGVTNLAVTHIDFGPNFDPESIDGTLLMKDINRFARAQTDIKTNQTE